MALRRSQLELEENHPCVKWKSGRDQKWAWSPEKNWHTVHKVSQLSGVNDPAVRFPITKKSSGYEIGKFHKKGQFFPKKGQSHKKRLPFPGNFKMWNLIWLQDHILQTIWKLCGLRVIFLGDHAHFWSRPLFHFTRGCFSSNSSYERRRALIFGLKDAQWAHLYKCYW